MCKFWLFLRGWPSQGFKKLQTGYLNTTTTNFCIMIGLLAKVIWPLLWLSINSHKPAFGNFYKHCLLVPCSDHFTHCLSSNTPTEHSLPPFPIVTDDGVGKEERKQPAASIQSVWLTHLLLLPYPNLCARRRRRRDKPMRAYLHRNTKREKVVT